MKDPDLRSHLNQCNCFAMRRAARRISRFYDDMLQESGLRVTQYLILALLHDTPGISINVMAERLDLERTAMGKNLRSLERDDLVRIEISPSDSRSRDVFLTEVGTEKFRVARALWQKAQRRFGQANGTQETVRLRSTLDALVMPIA